MAPIKSCRVLFVFRWVKMFSLFWIFSVLLLAMSRFCINIPLTSLCDIFYPLTGSRGPLPQVTLFQ